MFNLTPREPIEVFFNRPDRPIDIDQILAEIKRARRSLCIASAWFTDTAIADAFIGSNADIKIILLNQSDVQRGEKQAYKRVLLWNKNGYNEAFDDGVFVLGSGDWQEGVMHHKFIIIDMSVVWVGSYNFTFQARKNYETILRIADPNVAKAFWSEAEDLRDIARGGNHDWLVDVPVRCSICNELYPESKIAAAGTGDFAMCITCFERQEDEEYERYKQANP